MELDALEQPFANQRLKAWVGKVIASTFGRLRKPSLRSSEVGRRRRRSGPPETDPYRILHALEVYFGPAVDRTVLGRYDLTMAYCPFCTQGLPPDSDWCPHCQRALGEDVFESPVAEAKPSGWQKSGAVYTFEETVRCPHCRKPIQTARVLRLSRTQVAFTSTLPRSGRTMVCPRCEGILSVELAGLP